MLRSRLGDGFVGGWRSDERHGEMGEVYGLTAGVEFTRRITGSSIQGERIDKVNKRNEKAHIIISQENHTIANEGIDATQPQKNSKPKATRRRGSYSFSPPPISSPINLLNSANSSLGMG